MEKKVYISGMHSGQSPCAGVGIARSLRKAFPELKIIGVDHWHGSSGLHHPDLDDVLILPTWKQINSRGHTQFLRRILDEGHLWFSALDVEVYWLAQNFGTHENLLAPSGEALELTAKPSLKGFSDLGFRVPDYISAFLSDSEVHSFLRQNAWQCWLKGPYHDAKRITSWESFEKHRDAMKKEWKTAKLFLQRNIIGNEESICFAAYQGKLVSAVHMQKRLVTGEGKTWAGIVTPVSPEFFQQFQEAIRPLKWSGGGEIEYTRDLDGNKWVIECNPRFPAWVYGSALSGVNLPAKIIADAWQMPFMESLPRYPGFTRVVQEIPAKESIGLPYPIDPTQITWSSDGGKGKGGAPAAASVMPNLRDSMEQRNPLDVLFEETEEDETESDYSGYSEQNVPENYHAEIKEICETFEGETPTRIHLKDWTFSRFESILNKIKESHSKPAIKIGYSVKTSSTDDHLKHAQSCGFLTECISQMEVQRAMNIGVPAHEIILNGPGKFWPLTSPSVHGVHILFCDSIEEFDRVVEIPGIAKVIGFRIQLPKLPSRFGIPVDKIENFQKVVASVRKLNNRAQLGFHFHMPSWAIGFKRWQEAFQSMLTWCHAIEQLTGVSVRHLDLGGGFFPSDLEKLDFRWIQEMAKEILPKVEAIYFEPGRSLTQEGEIIISRILDIRKDHKNEVTEAVVDACIAELPLISSYYHRVFFKSDQNFTSLNKGRTKILGRICMENDVLAKGLNIPADAKIGDFIIFGDAGAYERTMSYAFGRG